mgnify:CR=1 FL=1
MARTEVVFDCTPSSLWIDGPYNNVQAWHCVPGTFSQGERLEPMKRKSVAAVPRRKVVKYLRPTGNGKTRRRRSEKPLKK